MLLYCYDSISERLSFSSRFYKIYPKNKRKIKKKRYIVLYNVKGSLSENENVSDTKIYEGI